MYRISGKWFIVKVTLDDSFHCKSEAWLGQQINRDDWFRTIAIENYTNDSFVVATYYIKDQQIAALFKLMFG